MRTSRRHRAQAWRGSVGGRHSCRRASSQSCIAVRQLRLDPAAELDRGSASRRRREAGGARQPVGEHVGAQRPRCRRTARHREGQASLAVGERHVDRLLGRAAVSTGSPSGELAGAELDGHRSRPRPGSRAAPPGYLASGHERLELDRDRGARRPADDLLARGIEAASFLRGQRTPGAYCARPIAGPAARRGGPPRLEHGGPGRGGRAARPPWRKAACKRFTGCRRAPRIGMVGRLRRSDEAIRKQVASEGAVSWLKAP